MYDRAGRTGRCQLSADEQSYPAYSVLLCVLISNIHHPPPTTHHQTEDSLFNVARMKEGRGGDDQIFSLRAAVQSANDAASRAAEDFHNSNKASFALLVVLLVVL